MADKLPYGGNSPSTTMLYLNDSFSLPAFRGSISDLEYDLRVGKITQEQYDAATTREVAAVNPSKRTAVRKTPRTR